MLLGLAFCCFSILLSLSLSTFFIFIFDITSSFCFAKAFLFLFLHFLIASIFNSSLLRLVFLCITCNFNFILISSTAFRRSYLLYYSSLFVATFSHITSTICDYFLMQRPPSLFIIKLTLTDTLYYVYINVDWTNIRSIAY